MPYLNEKNTFLFSYLIHLYIEEYISKLKLTISAANNGGLSKFKQCETNVILCFIPINLL